jgi:hypothetical protein
MIIQAAAKGMIPMPADLRDRDWWTRLGWILDRIEADNVSRLLALRIPQRLKLVELMRDAKSPQLTDLWDSVDKIYDQLFKNYFPWTTTLTDQAPRDTWSAAFGDPNDPEVQKSIDEAVEYLNNTTRAAKAKAAEVIRRNKRPALSKLGRK